MSGAGPASGTDFFDRDRLDGIAGSTFVLLRDTSRAVDLISRAIERRPYSDAKGRALLILDQATCRIIASYRSRVVSSSSATSSHCSIAWRTVMAVFGWRSSSTWC